MSELLDYLLQHDPNFRKARLPALYSDFRSQRTLNPDGFAANVSAWNRGLANAALAGHVPSKSHARNHLTLELDTALPRALENKQFGSPLALGTALQEALANGEMMPLPQFLKATQSIYQKSWGHIPWAVAGWALRQIGLTSGPSDAMPNGKVVVVLQNLEVIAKAFADATTHRIAPFERIFSRTHFRRTFEANLLEGQKLSDNDFEVLVKFLSRDKGALAVEGNTIKIRDASENPTISEEDSAIASLKELMADLTRQTEDLSRRVDQLNQLAVEMVNKKHRVSALETLRMKKMTEKNLATRQATLHQLEDVATKIQQASDNVQLVRVMESSTGALRSLNAQVGGADRVDAVLDSLREQITEVDEVGNLIAGVVEVDEGEVDDAYKALLAEQSETERVKKEAEEAEKTRRKLAELDKLRPVSEPVGEAAASKEDQASTPVTATANELTAMRI